MINVVKKIPKNVFFALFFCVVSLFLLRSEETRAQQRTLGLQTQIKADQKSIYEWEQILLERPDYRDGWIQLAANYYQSGDKDHALEAILKAKSLDPNNEIILSFEKFLNN